MIASGREDKVLQRLSQGEEIGTLLIPNSSQIAARKQWIIGQVQASGTLYLDNGACKAILDNGTSLLPVGVENAEGCFNRGDVVDCKDPSGKEIARGLVNYSNTEVAKIYKTPSNKVTEVLGYMGETELIHRDNLAII